MLDRILNPRVASTIPLAAAALLAGCGTPPNAGGGLELPGPIRVYVLVGPDDNASTAPAATRIAARQWRLWGVQGQTADSTTLESRGLLSDSSNIITLPPDSGTFLVEAWTSTEPPDSVDIRVKVATSSLPSASNCMNNIAAGANPTSIRGCTQAKNASPSAVSALGAANLPDVLTMVHIPGNPSHQFRIMGTSGDTLSVGEARLWKFNGTMSFRGILKQTGSVSPELPTLGSNESYVIEAWKAPNSGPVRIATKVAVPDTLAVELNACKIPFTDPLPQILTLHQCRFAAPNPSGGSVRPDYAAVMGYVAGN